LIIDKMMSKEQGSPVDRPAVRPIGLWRKWGGCYESSMVPEVLIAAERFNGLTV
jgi:hypothetical protein